MTKSRGMKFAQIFNFIIAAHFKTEDVHPDIVNYYDFPLISILQIIGPNNNL